MGASGAKGRKWAHGFIMRDSPGFVNWNGESENGSEKKIRARFRFLLAFVSSLNETAPGALRRIPAIWRRGNVGLR